MAMLARLTLRAWRRHRALLVVVARATGERGACSSLRAVAALPGVLLHRLVDEVVDAALELARHLLEGLPEHIAALERSGALLVGIRAHLDAITSP
jgi:hypothetical protein